MIELDDDDDGVISGDDINGDASGDGDGDGDGDVNEFNIKVVEDGNLKIKWHPVAPTNATWKDLPNTNEEESDSDEDGESTCWTRPHFWILKH